MADSLSFLFLSWILLFLALSYSAGEERREEGLKDTVERLLMQEARRPCLRTLTTTRRLPFSINFLARGKVAFFSTCISPEKIRSQTWRFSFFHFFFSCSWNFVDFNRVGISERGRLFGSVERATGKKLSENRHFTKFEGGLVGNKKTKQRKNKIKKSK